MKFEELDLSNDILDALDAMHFEECTPIQEQAIPVIIEGKDLIAIAQTGTGKTAAYLLPVIDYLAYNKDERNSIKCIIMAPTRELARQIDVQMEGFGYFLPVSSVPIYGGTDGKTFAQQQNGLKRGADVVIATPGRLIAHINMGYVNLSDVEVLILDEADRMLDMGFYDDIMQIVNKLPKNRQTLLFSATMPPKIKQLAKTILYEPEEVKIAVSKPAEKIEQTAYLIYENFKPDMLCHVLNTVTRNRVIVFADSKLKVKDLAIRMRRNKFKVAEMHSDLEQTQREEIMHKFTTGKIDILIATNIISRGIDIDDIELVVNYDVPGEPEDYIHRIGRTARANNSGKAVTFISERDRIRFKRIEELLEAEINKPALPEGMGESPSYPPKSDSGGGKGRFGGRRNGRRGSNKPSGDKPANCKKQNGNHRRFHGKKSAGNGKATDK
ncbi:MAG: DEAD/DEAH box helicase [Muribaculaceae bacterium]|nr:DEAD/DEAH box helicase [Muribaculaceae bacterium]